MSTLKLLLTVYVIGGLTFIPLIIALVLLTIYYTSPDVSKLPTSTSPPEDPANLVRRDSSQEKLILKTATDGLAEKFHRKHDSDVAAGYFAVCREYVPGGVNGKPPDKLSPAGEVVATESPSVYQSMYRSIFDRSQKPTLEPHKDASIAEGGVRKVKKANNVFYVVLRHGHLMLYDDIQQLEVRYVISLEYHDVDIFSGVEGETIPEAELWVKRNAIRLRRKHVHVAERNTSWPFFFFSEHLSEKEDFYFALLKNQEKTAKDMPTAQEFDTKDIITLVKKLHSSEEQLETRWLNALAGRLFLALYKTPFLEDTIRKKLSKKLSRVKKPNFITKLALQKIDPGSGAPFVTNPRLKDLSVNGDCVAEMDIEYAGNFRIEVAATARIDLGSRFKAREVDMVLAATCKRLTGRLLLRLKPQPSNRLWFSFEKMPKVDMVLEPIVSTRQITYGVILKALESRIMEVIAETLVLPFWDDIPFLDTEDETYRGGIWKAEGTAVKHTEIKDEDAEDEAEAGKEVDKEVIEHLKKDDRTLSMPVLSDSARSSTALNAAKKSVSSLREAMSAHGPDKSPRSQAPRVLRSTSFASAADPTLSPTHSHIATPTLDVNDAKKRDSMLADFSRALGTSPSSHSGSLPTDSTLEKAMRDRARSDTSNLSIEEKSRPGLEGQESGEPQNTVGNGSTRTSNSSIPGTDASSSPTSNRSRTPSMHESHHKGLTEAARSLASVDRKQAMYSINAAATAAQKWGWGVLARNRQREAEAAATREAATGSHRMPMGRGQPLPPPGTPLPGPEKPGLFGMPKRKSVQPKRPSAPDLAADSDSGRGSPQPPSLPDRPDRRRRQVSLQNEEDKDDELLVVEAPSESNPTTPVGEHHDDFFGHDEEPEQQRHQRADLEVDIEPPVLPVRPDHLKDVSLDHATGGAIKRAEEEYLAGGSGVV